MAASSLDKKINAKKLLTLLVAIEKNQEDIQTKLHRALSGLPPGVLGRTTRQDLSDWSDKILREIPRLRQKVSSGKPDAALRALRTSALQWATSANTFNVLLVLWMLLRDVVRLEIPRWFPASARPGLAEAGEKFWSSCLVEIMNAYLHFTNRIIQEKTLESSVLFHTTQSITTELDLESLLSKIVFHAGMLIRNKQVFLFVSSPKPLDPKETQRLFLRASNQAVEAYGEYTLRFGEGPVGEAAETRLPVLDNAYGKSSRKLPFLSEALHILAVPIAFSDEVLAVLVSAGQRRAKPISEDERDLLLMYAQQIAVTFKNVLLYQEETQVARELEEKNQMLESQADLILRKSAQMEVLNEISQQVNSSLELKEVLSLLARQAAQSIGLDRGVVWLFENSEISLKAVAAFGLPVKLLDKLRFDLPDIKDTAFFKVLSDRRPLQIRAGEDHDFYEKVLDGHLRINHQLVIPLLFKEEAIGLLAVDDTRESHEFLDDELNLISAIANHAVLAIENARLFEKVKEQAITDGLTGVYNHRFFQLRFSDEFAHCRRYSNDLSLIMMDIDHFKTYNDTYGHVAGDLALKEIANLIRVSVRENDIVARYGGEEFAIILPMTNASGARIVAERIRQSAETCRFLGDVNLPQVTITVSLGISSFNPHLSSREELIRQADDALYTAKEGGRNRTVIYPKALELEEGEA